MTLHVAVDTETTGLDASKSALLEIGAIILDGLTPVKGPEGQDLTFHAYLRPHQGAVIEDQAVEVNGMTWALDPTCEAYEAALPPEQAWQQFYNFVHKHISKHQPGFITIVGWNPAFDARFLQALHARYCRWAASPLGDTAHPLLTKWPFSYQTFDLISVVRYLDLTHGKGRRSYRLQKVLSDFNMRDAGAKYGAAHTAMADIYASLEAVKLFEHDA